MTSEPGDVKLTMSINAAADMAMFSKTLMKATATVKQPQKTDLRRRDRGPAAMSSSLYAASGTADLRADEVTYLQTHFTTSPHQSSISIISRPSILSDKLLTL